jgi:hypothetical protein
MNGLQEICYLPTWPVGFPRKGRMPPPPPGPGRPHPERLTSFDFRTMVMESFAEEMWNIIQPESDEWIRPQPKCVRRIDPYY